MSNETTNNYKESLDEIEKGDPIIIVATSGYGLRYSKVIAEKVTRTQITTGTTYPVTYRRKDGHRIGDTEGRTTAYAPNQIVNPWSADKKTALQLMEEDAAARAAKVERNNNMSYIENNMRNVSNELLAQMVAMMTEEKAKRDAEFDAKYKL